jgi:hypothetical protein
LRLLYSIQVLVVSSVNHFAENWWAPFCHSGWLTIGNG